MNSATVDGPIERPCRERRIVRIHEKSGRVSDLRDRAISCIRLRGATAQQLATNADLIVTGQKIALDPPSPEVP
jgi:hypothetical protein